MGRRRGDPRLVLRGDAFYGFYYDEVDRLQRRSTGTADRRVAQARLDEWVRAVRNDLDGTAPNVPRNTKVDELIDLAIRNKERRGLTSARTDRSHKKHLLRHLGGRKASEILPDTLEEYQQKRLGEGASPKTVDNELMLLSRGFHLGQENRRVFFVPRIGKLVSQHANAREVDPISFSDAMRLLEAVKRRDVDLGDWLEFQFWTGARNRQISMLEHRDVIAAKRTGEDWDAIAFRPETVKIRRPVTLAVAGVLIPIMQRRAAARRTDSPLVFHRHGRPLRSRAEGLPKDCYVVWREACEEVGVTGLTPYCFRHLAASRLRRVGVDIAIRSYVMGQKPPEMNARYDQIELEDTAEVFEKLATWADEQRRKPAKLAAIGAKA